MNLFDNPYAQMIPPTKVEKGDVVAVNNTSTNAVSVVLLASVGKGRNPNDQIEGVGFKVSNNGTFSIAPVVIAVSKDVTAVKLVGRTVDIKGMTGQNPTIVVDTFGGNTTTLTPTTPNSEVDAMIDSINNTMSKLGVDSVTIDGETDLHGQPIVQDEPEKKPERPMSDITFKRSTPCMNSVFEQLYGKDILIKEKP